MVKKLLLVFVLSLSLISCSDTEPTPDGGGDKITDNPIPVPAPIKNAKPGTGRVVILGDSLAQGEGAPDSSPYIPENCLIRGTKSRVENYSFSGATTEDVQAQIRAEQEIGAKKAKLVFISAGGNDALLDASHSYDIPERETLENLKSIFAFYQTEGALVVYLGLNPPYKGSERLLKAITLAEKMGVLVVKGMDGLWQDKSKMSRDGIHPNEQGYKILCERVISATQGYYP